MARREKPTWRQEQRTLHEKAVAQLKLELFTNENRGYFNDWGTPYSVPMEKMEEAEAWSIEEDGRLRAGKKERKLPEYFRLEQLPDIEDEDED